MKHYDSTLSRISVLLASGVWSEQAMRRRLRKHIGRTAPASQKKLVEELIAAFEGSPPPSSSELCPWLHVSRHFGRISKSIRGRNIRLPLLLKSPAFAPLPRFAGLEVPGIATCGELAEWLGVSIPHLDWLADTRHQHASASEISLQHYSFVVLKKSSGRPRLLEVPKNNIKRIQQKILREILDRLPVDDHAHGFVKGRSCQSSASVHVSETCVVAMDIRDFFHTVPQWRIRKLFRNVGYPHPVASLFTGLCMTTTPASIFDNTPDARSFNWTERKLLSQPHLPQGAPTSPALANLSVWCLDKRLAGLAARYDAHYTRYADDLAFSGDAEFAQRVSSFQHAVAAIVGDEGFSIHPDKSRVMRAHARQSLTGIVVNAHVNVARSEFDRLKAILNNCKCHGPSGQNRNGHADFRRHLEGRVNWVESLNPQRGAKLRSLFSAIAW